LRAPERFRIWRAGGNPGDYGELFYTPRANASVMGVYMQRGNALCMDIQHAMNPEINPKLDPADPPPTAGYLALESVSTADGPELWGVPRWSDCGRDAPVPGKVCCGKHQIESGQRCYVSPDWQIDTDTREPLILNRVSLVAEPGTWGVNLLASRAGAAQGKTQVDEKQIRAAYALASMQAAAAEGPLKDTAAAYVEQLKSAAAAMGVDLEKEPEAAPESKKPEAQAAAEPAKLTEPTKPEAQAAAVTAGKPLTAADFDRRFAEHTERQTLLAGIQGRVPEGHAQLVASMGLTQLRVYARGLPAPVDPDGKGGVRAANVTAGTDRVGKAEPLTALEQRDVDDLRAALGQTSENVTATRKILDASPTGDFDISLRSLVEKHIALRKPAAAAMRFGA
jgi:hypothetical protein